MKRAFFFLFLLHLLVSCASLPVQRQGGDGIQEQLRAENRLIKRKSELALRENEVLKTENARYRSEVKGLEEKLERLGKDKDALDMKYKEDMLQANEGYQHLCQKFAFFQQASDEKIGNMSEDYALLEQINEENLNRIGNLEAAAREQNGQIRKMETDLQEKLRDLEKMREEIQEQQAAMDRLTEKLNALQTAAEQSTVESPSGDDKER